MGGGASVQVMAGENQGQHLVIYNKDVHHHQLYLCRCVQSLAKSCNVCCNLISMNQLHYVCGECGILGYDICLVLSLPSYF